MNKDFYGECLCDFKNSWLFSPIAWDVLSEKYLTERITRNGFKLSFIYLCHSDSSFNIDLNRCINNCESMSDRIVWEMSNQQIFFTKDRKIVADGIRQFLKDNAKFDRFEDGTYPLEQEHIIERFEEIANSIEELDENKYPYFIFKNTSVDDGVERMFFKYNEDTDDNDKLSFKDCEEFEAEFVVIKDGKIDCFIKNTDFDYGKEVSEVE
jgi:hypothetical protein